MNNKVGNWFNFLISFSIILPISNQLASCETIKDNPIPSRSNPNGDYNIFDLHFLIEALFGIVAFVVVIKIIQQTFLWVDNHSLRRRNNNSIKDSEVGSILKEELNDKDSYNTNCIDVQTDEAKIPWDNNIEIVIDENQNYPVIQHGEIEESWGALWAFSDKKYEKAIDIAKQLLEEYKDSDNSIEYYLICVKSYLKKGDIKNAKAYLIQAIDFYNKSRKHIYSQQYLEAIEAVMNEVVE